MPRSLKKNSGTSLHEHIAVRRHDFHICAYEKKIFSAFYCAQADRHATPMKLGQI